MATTVIFERDPCRKKLVFGQIQFGPKQKSIEESCTLDLPPKGQHRGLIYDDQVSGSIGEKVAPCSWVSERVRANILVRTQQALQFYYMSRDTEVSMTEYVSHLDEP